MISAVYKRNKSTEDGYLFMVYADQWVLTDHIAFLMEDLVRVFVRTVAVAPCSAPAP